MTFKLGKKMPIITLLLFTVALALLLFSTVGGARAAITYGTNADAYMAEITFTPNKELSISRSGDLTDLGTGLFVPGKTYEENLTIANGGNTEDGDINKYIRVVVNKYWKDSTGAKMIEMDPSLISVSLDNSSAWLTDSAMQTTERDIFYYPQPVSAGSSATLGLCISIDGSVVQLVKQSSTTAGGYTTITNTYLYDGKMICIEIEADGVQTHHAEDAIMSAWGRAVTVSDGGTLTLS